MQPRDGEHKRRGVHVGVAQAVGGQAVQHGRLDQPAEAGQLPVADVVQHEEEHVGRALRGARRLRPGRRGLFGGASDDAGERGSIFVGLDCHILFSFIDWFSNFDFVGTVFAENLRPVRHARCAAPYPVPSVLDHVRPSICSAVRDHSPRGGLSIWMNGRIPLIGFHSVLLARLMAIFISGSLSSISSPDRSTVTR